MNIEALQISVSLETHRSWLAGRGWQVVVAELIPVTWHKASHLIGSNQIFNHDHDRIAKNARLEPVHSELTPATGEYVLIVGGSRIGLNVTTQ